MVDAFERRVGVPLTTARQMIVAGTDDHFRMALIVLDGLAELLARRVMAENEWLLGIASNLKDESDQAVAQGREPFPGLYPIILPTTESQSSLPEKSLPFLSARQRNKVWQEFGAAVNLAAFYDAVSYGGAQALNDAHYFRNQAYHNDKTDRASLAATVQVQAGAVAELLRGVRLTMRRILLPTEMHDLREALSIPEAVPLTQDGLADYLEEPYANAPAAAPAAFSASITWRVDGVAEGVDEIANFLNQPPGLTLENAPLDAPLKENGQVVAPNRALLDRWRQEAKDIAAIPDTREALRRFRIIHEPLEHLDAAVQRGVTLVDQEIDRAIDERRGR